MLCRLRTQIDSWWHVPPMPAPITTDRRPIFQKWNGYEQGVWTPLTARGRAGKFGHQRNGSLHLVSWNVNAYALFPEDRMSTLLRAIQQTVNTDVIFLQEVSRNALSRLLLDSWIQQHWYTSEADHSNFAKQSFATVTLISKLFLSTSPIALGPVWRILIPSRFGRDALRCDLLFSPFSKSPTRICLINVHLDSLPINPSKRPEQLLIVSSYLRAAGRGLVAGDFNSVLPKDDTVIARNGLVVAWTHLYPRDPGFAWGVDGDKPFPLNRLDKAATFGLNPSSMRVIYPCSSPHIRSNTSTKAPDGVLNFSDHCGLFCTLDWPDDQQISDRNDSWV